MGFNIKKAVSTAKGAATGGILGQALLGGAGSIPGAAAGGTIANQTYGQTGNQSAAELMKQNEANIQKRLTQGRERGEQIYGITSPEVGSSVRDIIQKRRAALAGEDPSTARMRRSRNERLRRARAQGMGPAQLEELRRGIDMDIESQEFARQQENLGSYQSLIGNILGGQTGLELGYGGLGAASQQAPMPRTSGGLLGGLGGGTVICTELYRQGYMDIETYKKDAAYGVTLRNERPDVYIGYRVLADPVVRQMKKSKLFTRLVSIPALAWARNMAGDKNLPGWAISFFGEKLCKLIGGIYAKTLYRHRKEISV